jgi:transposase
MAKRTRQAVHPSDLTDAEWESVQGVMPPPKTGGRHRDTDLRAVVNAILYAQQSGCAWRALPQGYPPPTTVYEYYSRWQRDGTLAKIHSMLKGPTRQPAGKPKKRSRH